MAAATSRDTGMVPYLALGIIVGVRSEELMRLGWEDITTQGVSINGHKAKTRQRRLITISENLKGWLSLGGDPPPKSRRRRLEAFRQDSGVPWKHDIIRHSFPTATNSPTTVHPTERPTNWATGTHRCSTATIGSLPQERLPKRSGPFGPRRRKRDT